MRHKRKLLERERMRKEKLARRAKEKEERRKRQRAEKQKEKRLEKQQRKEKLKAEQNQLKVKKQQQSQSDNVESQLPQFDTLNMNKMSPQQQHTEISHHYTVYDYVIESPPFYEYSKSHHRRTSSKSEGGHFLFNPLRNHIEDIPYHHIPPPPLKPPATIKIVRNSISLDNPSQTATANRPQIQSFSLKKEKTSEPLKAKSQLITTMTPAISSSRKLKVTDRKQNGKSKKKHNQHKKKNIKSKSNNLQGTNKNKNTKIRHSHKKRQSRSKRSSLIFDEHDIHHMEYHHNQCNHHRIDHCQWPQCNLSCPKYINHFTGQEVDFTDVLMQFGLDMSSLAHTLNIDEQTLYRMDRSQLLNLLIHT